jgi:hypothetical protein
LNFIKISNRKNHQWNTNAQQSQAKTAGGQNWKPPATNAPPSQPMASAWNPSLNVISSIKPIIILQYRKEKQFLFFK